jgi:hypothetical protein
LCAGHDIPFGFYDRRFLYGISHFRQVKANV